MTSRELYERVGGFREHKKEVFWLEDAGLHRGHRALGFRAAVLADLRVHHTGGPHYATTLEGEGRVLGALGEAQARRAAIKRSSSASRSPPPERALRLVRGADLAVRLGLAPARRYECTRVHRNDRRRHPHAQRERAHRALPRDAPRSAAADFELDVLVVDSGSTDSTLEIARDHGARIVELSPAEFDYSKALNIGIEAGPRRSRRQPLGPCHPARRAAGSRR